MIKEKNLILNPKAKKPIVYDVLYNQTKSPKPVVIFCHGYKGFKDWGAWQHMAETFADNGFFFIKFNFSHNGGTIEQPIDFPDLEAFANNNFTQELEDLEHIINATVTTKQFMQEADVEKINLIGHSRGGGIVLIKAEENEKIKKVVSWAGVSDFSKYFKEETDDFVNWRETGVTYVENSRTKQQMPHYFQFFEDYKSNKKRLDVKRAAQHIRKPHLIIHGSEDQTVSIEEAKNLHKWHPKSQMEIIEGANHVFGAEHPWQKETMPEDLAEVVRLTVAFLK